MAKFFIEYNGRFIDSRKTIRGAMCYIKKRGLKNGNGNTLSIVELGTGQEYHPVTGEKIMTE